jgi:hypothetical protein
MDREGTSAGMFMVPRKINWHGLIDEYQIMIDLMAIGQVLTYSME